jgi:hypothetical protein
VDSRGVGVLLRFMGSMGWGYGKKKKLISKKSFIKKA